MNFKKESEMFDKAADYYDQFRPSYPSEVLHQIIEKTRLNKDKLVLEIGSGSGKATEMFENLGCHILCIDPGENLVKLGRDKFANHKQIEFKLGRFETLDLQKNMYDLIYAAQSFHWVPQPIGYQKCADLLKADGYLALFWNMYILYDTAIDRELLTLSDKYGGFADFLSEKQCEQRIQNITHQIQEHNYFEQPEVFRVLWEEEYTAETLYGFIMTGNHFIQLPQDVKERAKAEVQTLCEKHGGTIKRPYLCVLYLSKKKRGNS